MRFGSRILPVLWISLSDLFENIIDFVRFPGVDGHSRLRLYLLSNDRRKLLNDTVNYLCLRLNTMTLFAEFYPSIRAVDVDRVRTQISYPHWERHLVTDSVMIDRLNVIRDKVGNSVTRQEIVNFYADSSVTLEAKFMLAMIWGHEATEGGRRDGRGPWKLMQMFKNRTTTDALIQSVDLSTDESLMASYRDLDANVDRCGPNFFTKHFYFLGKALGLTNYPLIFDDRVANGLVRRTLNDVSLLSVVSISTMRNPEAYVRFLRLAHKIAQSAQAEPDQVELFLFGQVA